MLLAKEPLDKNICNKCIEDPFLRKEILENGEKIKCSYCSRKAIGFSLGEFADRIAEALLTHYERSADQPSEEEYYRQHVSEDSSYFWYREGAEIFDIIEDHVLLPDGAAGDVLEYMRSANYDHEAATMGDESEFDVEALYEPKGFSDEKWQREWEGFEHILKSQSRYFNQEVNNYLNRVFRNIEGMQTSDGSPLITTAGPDEPIQHIYRARVFQSQQRLMESLSHPDQHLGPPPSEFAAAGRMNARGIPVFYGATNPKVALAEVRPPVGSNVAVAKFDIIRKVRLLNLPAFGEIRSHFEGSIFDPEYVPNLERAVFLRNLSKRMIVPVMPDHEVFEYLPTQVIADFLASNTDLKCEGIIFPSIQVPGDSLNVVLFNKAAKVAEIPLKKGTVVNAESERTDDEDESTPAIHVIETNARASKGKQKEPDFASIVESLRREYQMGTQFDTREDTLRVDTDSIVVNIVKGVDFQVLAREVKRITRDKSGKHLKIPKTDLDF